MPTFTLNGTAIELEPQTRESFAWLAGQVYRRLHEGPPLPAILTVFAHEGTTTQALPTTDGRIQAILWTLWQIGIASARVEGVGEKREVKWEKGEHANIDTRPIIEHFTEEGTTDGRALAAGLVVVAGRQVKVNGVEMHVKINNFELIKAQAAEMEKRRLDPKHDPAMAAASYLAELLSQGADQNDLRLRAAIELAADLGIRSLFIDAATRQLRIEGFNEQAALAAAYFQGAPVEQFQSAILRAQTLNKMALENAQKSGRSPATRADSVRTQSGTPELVSAPGKPGNQGQPTPFKRRRR
jgi:hypothetical protein